MISSYQSHLRNGDSRPELSRGSQSQICVTRSVELSHRLAWIDASSCSSIALRISGMASNSTLQDREAVRNKLQTVLRWMSIRESCMQNKKKRRRKCWLQHEQIAQVATWVRARSTSTIETVSASYATRHTFNSSRLLEQHLSQSKRMTARRYSRLSSSQPILRSPLSGVEISLRTISRHQTLTKTRYSSSSRLRSRVEKASYKTCMKIAGKWRTRW